MVRLGPDFRSCVRANCLRVTAVRSARYQIPRTPPSRPAEFTPRIRRPRDARPSDAGTPTGTGERLLDDVLGALPVADLRQGQPGQPERMLPVQGVSRCGVSALVIWIRLGAVTCLQAISLDLVTTGMPISCFSGCAPAGLIQLS